MIIQRSIQKYADARGIPLKDAFGEAWVYHFGHAPNWSEVWQDVRRYKEVRAVPIYVSQFLGNGSVARLMATPTARLLQVA